MAGPAALAADPAPKPSVYVETSVIGYLASRPSRDLLVAAAQQSTREWWATATTKFDLFVSEHVLAEYAAGDPKAAEERFAFVRQMRVVASAPQAEAIVDQLLREGAFPAKASVDAAHVVAAATGGIDFLVTWNCKHIANPAARRTIERVLIGEGLLPPIIYTPLELPDVR